ncbi:MAG: FAD-binding oxidoreductase, partial [Longimicrobiales bacterium]
MTFLTTGAAPIRELRAALGDAVIGPEEAAYDDARKVFYGGIDRRPAAIVRPTDAAGVARVVTIARTCGLELAVRSGGHSVVGYGVCDRGIVLDLSRLRTLDIDVGDRTVWAGTGLTAGEYTAAVGAHGVATGFGDAPSVGIGGITLGGGVGFLHRQYGLTLDSLLAAEVVTADGRILPTDASTHPDLFWAIRGGGGNFGVATRFLYRLHEVDAVYGGMLILAATADAIASFVSEAMNAPEELTCIAAVMPAPPMPFIPAERHGRPILFAQFMYAGPAEAGQRALAPFRA